MEKLIKNGDIILDGTLPRYAKEKQAFEKLEVLERHEEDLKIELDIFLKALKQGYVYYPIDCLEDCYKYEIECVYLKPQLHLYVADGVGGLYFEDYGKTWALTKEVKQ